MVQIHNIKEYSIEPLSQVDTMSLLTQAQCGCKESKEKIILANVKLVYSTLKRFKGIENEQDDLFQIGIIGLIKAIDRFDVTKNVAFSTYAVPTIIGEIKTHLRKDQQVKISRDIKSNALKIKKIREEYYKTNGKEISIDQLAEELELNVEDVLLAMLQDEHVISINQTVNDEDGEGSLEQIIAGETECEEKWVSRLEIEKGLTILTPKESFIIENRYFKDKTQCEIAEEVGLSQVQISRIEKKALQKMKQVF